MFFKIIIKNKNIKKTVAHINMQSLYDVMEEDAMCHFPSISSLAPLSESLQRIRAVWHCGQEPGEITTTFWLCDFGHIT